MERSVRFFFDSALPPKLARSFDILIAPEHAAMHLRDRFAADTPDENWMAVLASEHDWIVISGDPRTLRNPHRMAAWRQTELVMIFLRRRWMELGFWEQTQRLMKCFPRILEFAAGQPAAGAYSLSLNGRLVSLPARH
jgi:predicted nuclease of predicted toxin-antitoxin system